MWQPDIKLETTTYPAGGVAPSSYALALHTYTQKARACAVGNNVGMQIHGWPAIYPAVGNRMSLIENQRDP